ncbi:hypothetical protein TIFTF001_011658 [Ficus carica]|uniref:Uncharacterized protein n=1 Tax=Ficus carica TaxID=3494 RepID=A0AA88D4F1_FICCA|nr:hypothetical protein TIFTF001_011658 [Ficus carica]
MSNMLSKIKLANKITKTSCTVTLRRVTCKREALRSDGDTGGVSATSTPILKSEFPAGSGVLVTRSGRLPRTPGGQIGLRCAGAVCLISRRHVFMVWCQGTLRYATADTNGRSPYQSRLRKSAMGYGAAVDHTLGTTCEGLTVQGSHIIPSSPGRHGSGQQYPVWAEGYDSAILT